MRSVNCNQIKMSSGYFNIFLMPIEPFKIIKNEMRLEVRKINGFTKGSFLFFYGYIFIYIHKNELYVCVCVCDIV